MYSSPGTSFSTAYGALKYVSASEPVSSPAVTLNTVLPPRTRTPFVLPYTTARTAHFSSYGASATVQGCE